MCKTSVASLAILLASVVAVVSASNANTSTRRPSGCVDVQQKDRTSELAHRETTAVSTSEDQVLYLLQGEEFNGLDQLTSFPPEEVIPILIRQAARDSDSLIRQRSIIALGIIGDVSAVPVLEDGLKDRSVPVVVSSIEALARIGHESSAVEIIDLLKSDDASVRQTAAEALGDLSDPRSEPALRRMLQEENETFVRDAIEKSLDALQSGSEGSR